MPSSLGQLLKKRPSYTIMRLYYIVSIVHNKSISKVNFKLYYMFQNTVVLHNTNGHYHQQIGIRMPNADDNYKILCYHF